MEKQTRNSKDGRKNIDKIDEENNFIKNEANLDIQQRPKMIVAKVSNIFLSIKDAKYFNWLVGIMFFIVLLHSCLQFMIFNMYSPLINNYYCLNPFSREFEVCDQNVFCNNIQYGIKTIIFTDSGDITDKKVLRELHNINKKYRMFYLRDGGYYSADNAKFEKHIEVTLFYTIVISVTKNENWNFFNGVNQYCNRQIILIQVSLTIFLSTIMGNIIMGYCADIYGRKRALVFICFIQFLGCLIIFVTITLVVKWAEESADNNTSLSFHGEGGEKGFHTYYSLIDDEIFNFQGVNAMYQNMFPGMNKENIKSAYVTRNFSKYKIFYYIGLFFIYFGMSVSYNICIAHTLENSVNDASIYNNYSKLHFAIPIGFLLQYILLYYIDSFTIPYLVIGCLLLIVAILLIIFTYESPRHNYEFSEYSEITKFFEKILPQKDCVKLYTDMDNEKVQKELQKAHREKFKGYWRIFCNKILFLGLKNRIGYYSNLQRKGKLNEISKNELVKHPFLLYSIMRKNKVVKNNILIILSLVANIGLIYFLVVAKLMDNLVYSRQELYSGYVINTPIFYMTILSLIAIWFFNFLLKFFGFTILLFISFINIFIFSLAFEIISFNDRTPEDMNKYTYNSKDILYDRESKSLRVIFCVIIFFTYGLFSTLYFLLTKISRTLYRCLLFGIFRSLLDFTMLLAVALSQYFDKNFFYLSVLSGIGFVNAYFIKEDFGGGIVEDFRKIESEGY